MADDLRIPEADTLARKAYDLGRTTPGGQRPYRPRWTLGTRSGEDRRRADAHRRRTLRIAIRQLERAELYLVALYSLDIDELCAEEDVDGLVQQLRLLHQHLLKLKLTA